MARETKAERLAREAREREERMEAERLAYPLRLMNLLERVSAEPTLTLTVSNGYFNVEDREDRYRKDYVLSYSYSPDANAVLDDLTYKVDDLAAERAEAERRYAVKKEAERKVRELLSDEERELLGL